MGDQNAILDVRMAWTKSYFVALLTLIYKMKFGFFSKHLTWLPFGIKSTVNVICNWPQLLERWIDESLYSGEGKGLIH